MGIHLYIIRCANVYKYIHIVVENVKFIRVINSVAVINNMYVFLNIYYKI
jgi:hypothetical protein